jgi:hypothetical protein
MKSCPRQRYVVASAIAGHGHLSAARTNSNKGPIMELMEAISGRRSIRDYKPDPVAREAITRLIDAAIQAPSAMKPATMVLRGHSETVAARSDIT